MRFTSKIKAVEEKNSFLLKDCSSYGAIGFKIDDIINSFLEIQPPSATEKYPFKVVTYPDFPNKDGLDYEVLPTDVKSNEIESGEWKLKFTTVFKTKTGGSITKTAFLSVVFINSVDCCIDKMTPALNGNAANDPKQKAIIELSNLLESVHRQIGQGLNGEANKTIEYLKAQCKCCGCS